MFTNVNEPIFKFSTLRTFLKHASDFYIYCSGLELLFGSFAIISMRFFTLIETNGHLYIFSPRNVRLFWCLCIQTKSPEMWALAKHTCLASRAIFPIHHHQDQTTTTHLTIYMYEDTSMEYQIETCPSDLHGCWKYLCVIYIHTCCLLLFISPAKNQDEN